MSDVAASARELQAFLDACPFNRFSGFEITAVDAECGSLRMRMPLREEFRRLPDSDQIHGGPIAALIDTAGCVAVMAMVGAVVPTIAFSTHYLRPAAGLTLTAAARVIRAGRSVAIADVEIFSDTDALLAIGRGIYGTSGARSDSRR